ncbi:MAG: hypothetical protein H6555_11055 [Lewinellaceae bacterium]|nr:hypothetical protein [Lewinellaceae bacterium]
MLRSERLYTAAYKWLLSKEVKEKGERAIIFIAIGSFLLHVLVIALVDSNLIHFSQESKLLKNPIAAIYTPFSFILIYEVYLLIYYLPKSFSIYIGKQYEIITLIIIRRIFKDLSNLELSSDWFKINYDLQFTVDLLASLILFLLIFLFYKLSKRKEYSPKEEASFPPSIQRFIKLKKLIAVCLVPLLLILAIYSSSKWFLESFFQAGNVVSPPSKNINSVFFDQFFTILIMVDVLLLLFSFLHTDEFHKVMRNSGFIISTILIRLSFAVDGVINTLLIVSALGFGVAILLIHNLFEKHANQVQLNPGKG